MHAADPATPTAAADADPAPAPAPGGGARRSRAAVVATVLAAVFFASTVALAAVAADLGDDGNAGDRRREVADVAGRFVEAVTTYDHRRPDAAREAVLSLSAAPFAEQYEAALPAIQEGLAAAGSVSAGTARAVFLAEVGDGGTATAVVEYDRVLDGAAGQRTESNRYLRLGLVELDGAWRVNDVIDLNVVFAGASPGEQAPAPGAPPG